MELQEKVRAADGEDPHSPLHRSHRWDRADASHCRCLPWSCAFLLLLCIALLTALLTVMARADPPSIANCTQTQPAADAGGGVCTSADCVTLTARLVQSRDVRVSPCDDVYLHACAGWQRHVQQLGLDAGRAEYSANVHQVHEKIDWQLAELLKSGNFRHIQGFSQAHDFFQFCMESLPTSRALLNAAADRILRAELGGLRSPASWEARPVALTILLVRLGRLLGAPLLDVSRTVDPRNHSQHALILGAGQLGQSSAAKGLRRRPLQTQHFPFLSRSTDDTWPDQLLSSGFHHQHARGRRATRVDSGQGVNTEAYVDPPVWDQQSDNHASETRNTPSSEGEPPPEIGDYVDSSRLFEALQWKDAEERRNNSLEFFLRNIRAQNMSNDFSMKDLRKLDELLEMLHKVGPSSRERAHQEADSHLTYSYHMTIDELQTSITQINWMQLFAELLEVPVQDDDIVYIPFPGYLEDVALILDLFPAWAVHNALLLIYRTEELSSIVDKLSAAGASDRDRSTFCTDTVTQVLPVSVAAMYVRSVGKQEVDALRKEVSAVMEVVQSELVHSLQQQQQLPGQPLSTQLLDKMADKVRRVRTLIATSDRLWDDAFVAEHAPDLHRLNISGTQYLSRVDGDGDAGHHVLLQLLRSLDDVRRFVTRRQQPIHVQQSEEHVWSYIVQPFIPNAFYIPDNIVVVPLAFLSEPHFYWEVPAAVRFSLLGAALAHELLHSIGLAGMHYDGGGVLRPLSEAEEEELQQARQCVLQNYTAGLSRHMQLAGFNFSTELSPALALDENLSDRGSVELAWRAYLRWRHQHNTADAPAASDHAGRGQQQQQQQPAAQLRVPGVDLSEKQLFAISLAQTYCSVSTPISYVISGQTVTHLPSHERVNAMLRQWSQFPAAFQCRHDAPMYLSSTCPSL